MGRALDVAVIGAGPAGLVMARELKREGHNVVIFEKSDRLGGIWAYDSQVEDDPMGINPNRQEKHSSLYRAVRTTIPKEIMGFSDYPFTVKDKNGILKEFPGHEEIHKYLNHFAQDYDLNRLTRLRTKVVRVEQTTENGPWTVGWTSETDSDEELFDAVVICNGHYSQPNVVEIPGIKKWPGTQIHSHNYRVPEPYQDQRVVVIGDGISAHDISLDVSQVAKDVHIVSRAVGVVSGMIDECDNLWLHPKVQIH
ncbi:OLC1v1020548C1 [Oldenlandia corymbosa var. corymbosa]|uniref:Flavin-containing monooxygenase n=1 Tax=Oldenlandia corymbosa var. corymbosa TaxID=529605 RepID=A0AAV1EH85_OLDCO|nr:OLC1v1020548C1 [Oldenlandia corymbosa var. corymbosa]